MIQSQMINLVIGVVPRPSRITHATSDRVGACGAKLLNGFKRNTSGRPAYSFPSGSRSIHQSVRTPASANVSSAKGFASRRLVRS